ncbi:hypothetical protein VTJ04DRAFT_7247 [Mycothermus thermophilus]|uniref:uncharacterized protein n=1 Tax=Humicola insolens TaxID=85995 RepID=UPI003743A0F2
MNIRFLSIWPSSPDHPHNWPRKYKLRHLLVTCAWTFLSSFSSTATVSITPLITSTLNKHSPLPRSSNPVATGLITTAYLFGLAAGPVLFTPLSRRYGRRRLHEGAAVLFLLFTLACGLAGSVEMLVAFRVLAGVFGSCALAVGRVRLRDLTPPGTVEAEIVRARYTLSRVFGFAVAPVIAGGVAHVLTSWRSVFFGIVVFSTVLFIFDELLLGRTGGAHDRAETSAVHLLRARAKRMSKATGWNHHARPDTDGRRDESTLSLWKQMLQPLYTVWFSSFLVRWYAHFACVMFALQYATLTSLVYVYGDMLGGVEALDAPGLFVGFAAGVVLGWIPCAVAERMARRKQDIRPHVMATLLGSVLSAAGFLVYSVYPVREVAGAWRLSATHVLIGAGTTAMVGPVPGLIRAKLGPATAPDAVRSFVFWKCLFATILPLGARQMYARMGRREGNQILFWAQLGGLVVNFAFSMIYFAPRRARRAAAAAEEGEGEE